MTTNQIQSVKDSWNFVAENISDPGMIFYNQLFTLDPDLKALFKEDRAAQSKKLITMLSFVVSKLDKINEIVPQVKALGARHNKYNVKPEHYRTVAQALLKTLEMALGERWNDETKSAWIAAYTILSTTMIEAAKEASSVSQAA
jgi:hemoglobin-like flavoprotein